MKISFTIGLVIFWTAVIALAIAGLVSHENQKLYDSLSTTQTGTGNTSSVLGDAEQELIAASGVSTWTPELVALHSVRDDCWMTIEDNIYDVSEYVPFHPGGEQTILDLCGAEATEAFKTKGGTGSDHSASAWSMLENYFVASIGDELPANGARAARSGTASTQTNQGSTADTQKVVSTPQQETQQTQTQTQQQPDPQPSSALTTTTVAAHNSTGDCWLIINNKVYDVTQYIPFHPGGTNTIQPYCGKESTNAFSTKGGDGSNHSGSAWSQLDNYLIGSLGAEATEAVVAKQPVPEPEPQPEPEPVVQQSSSELTTSLIAQHNSLNDCWLIISNKVYDVTQYVPFHPGGKNTIQPYCGKESTNAFQTKGGGGGNHSSGAWNQLDTYYIGDVGSTATVDTTPSTDPEPVTITTLAAADVAPHNNTGDCWLIINGNVYDVTQYIPYHPGGTNTIRPYCGKEATQGFKTKGDEGENHSSSAWNQLSGYLVGTFEGGTISDGADVSAPADPTEPYREAILAEYPGAHIEKLKVEDDGKAEFKFTHNGQEYEGKMDASYNITKIEGD